MAELQAQAKVMETQVYTVEKNVPLPPPPKNHLRYTFFLTMEPGDSVALPPTAHRLSIKNRAHYIAVRTGREFTIRQMADKSYRIWRIK